MRKYRDVKLDTEVGMDDEILFDEFDDEDGEAEDVINENLLSEDDINVETDVEEDSAEFAGMTEE